MKTLSKTLVASLAAALFAGSCAARAEESAQPAANAPAVDHKPAAAGDTEIEAKTCKTIANHECSDPTGTFAAADGTVLTWNRITGLAGKKVHHVYFHGDKQVSDIVLDVTRSPYRTYSRKRLPDSPQGDWRVEIRDEGGAVLQTVKFAVK